MRKVYTTSSIFLLLLFCFSCSKDILKSYDKRVLGNWKINDIDKIGIGSSGGQPFSENGLISFLDNGRLTYTYAGRTYQGSWDIRNEWREDKNVKSLQITAVDFSNQEVLTDFFNEIVFTGTNKFKGLIYSGSKTYVYHFSRQ